jgi:ferredoxin-type protein NapH
VQNWKDFIHKWAWIVLIVFIGAGIFYPAIGVLALLCMLAPVAVAFFQGRAWCGSYCPRGSFNDNILAKLSWRRKLPPLLKNRWFRIIFLVLLMSGFALQIILVWGNPFKIGQVFVRMIIITTLITLVLGLIYHPRTWCRICPMGTMAHYISKWRSGSGGFKWVTFKRNNACTGCQVCTKNCPIHIDVHNYKTTGRVTHPDCLKCRVCIAKCPKKALQMDSD